MTLHIANLETANFKNERQLIQHLVKNLDLIEPGLQLYKENGVSGVEVPCRITDWGRQGSIDILTVAKNKDVVVIECKHKYGDGMAFGQLLAYMCWIKRRLAELGDTTTKVRGVIVAKRANPLLRLLLDEYPDANIAVYEFQDPTTLTKLG